MVSGWNVRCLEADTIKATGIMALNMGFAHKILEAGHNCNKIYFLSILINFEYSNYLVSIHIRVDLL